MPRPRISYSTAHSISTWHCLHPLAQLHISDELLPALAGALGVQLPPGGDLQETVLLHLTNQQMLLVLDNFEHLLKEAILIAEILANSSQVKVLVASREKLNLEAETIYHLDGLQLPPQDILEAVENYDAIRLFLQKAAQTCPGFSLDVENTLSVVQICQTVNGNPLGILLAAAWLEYFSPAEIAGEHEIVKAAYANYYTSFVCQRAKQRLCHESAQR